MQPGGGAQIAGAQGDEAGDCAHDRGVQHIKPGVYAVGARIKMQRAKQGRRQDRPDPDTAKPRAQLLQKVSAKHQLFGQRLHEDQHQRRDQPGDPGGQGGGGADCGSFGLGQDQLFHAHRGEIHQPQPGSDIQPVPELAPIHAHQGAKQAAIPAFVQQRQDDQQGDVKADEGCEKHRSPRGGAARQQGLGLGVQGGCSGDENAKGGGKIASRDQDDPHQGAPDLCAFQRRLPKRGLCHGILLTRHLVQLRQRDPPRKPL